MNITQPFEKLPVSDEWVFKNIKSTQQWTHGYHRYPAKFLPNLVKKIIEDYTEPGDIIADMFAGCGTTLVESKIHGRKSVGVDINPVAQLITNVKTSPIRQGLLESKFQIILSEIENFRPEDFHNIEKHARIDYWFYPSEKYKIAFLYQIITELKTTKKVKNFFLVALSNILKNCSKWLQSSTKPQIDSDKKPTEVFKAFNRQVKSMLKQNERFFNRLEELQFTNIESKLVLEDARDTSIKPGTINAIITSPPYVTSYEYADLHQLTGYWFEYLNNLLEFRSNFIGTFYSYGESLKSNSKIAQAAIDDLKDIHLRTAKEVANYFNDMYDVANEMHRVLKNGGKTFVVIGNTTFKNVKIQSAEIFAELLELIGFTIENVIKRSIPNKLIPTIRDKHTGKFTTLDNKNSKEVYPEEYIIIARKP